MSSVLSLHTVNQEFPVTDGTTGSIPDTLRDITLAPTVEEVQVLKVNLTTSLIDEVIDLTSVEKPVAFYFDCDQEITVKLGDGSTEITFPNMVSGVLNFGTADTKSITLKVTTPAEFPTPAGETVAPTSATLYVFLAGDRS